MKNLFIFLVIVPYLSQPALILALRRSRLYKKYPFFLAYQLFELVLSVIMLPLRSYLSEAIYAYLYITYSIFAMALAFLVMAEMASEAFSPYPALAILQKRIFYSVTFVILTISLFMA